MNLREKRMITIKQQLKPVIPIVRSWFLDEGLQFMKSNKLSNPEEAILEKFADQCLATLDEVEGKICGKI